MRMWELTQFMMLLPKLPPSPLRQSEQEAAAEG